MTSSIENIITQLSAEVPLIINNLHFIRADWFYAFIPLMLYLLLATRSRQNDKNWRTVIDPQLAPFVLTHSHGKRRRYQLLLVLIATSLCITALAGPVYKKLPQPVYREQSSLVILLDLSQSMNASDIKPSRLARAKLELLDLLKTRKTGQTALIVYAADAFVVTPLTDDNATIANLVPSLDTSMMPAQGSNLSAALAKTFSLFSQAGIINGDILVITDDIHPRHQKAIGKVASQGHSLSIFGIGTSAGGPIPLSEESGGGFLLDRHGAIVIPKLDPKKLQSYALSGAGLYTSLKADDSDVEKLAALFQSKKISHDNKQQNNDEKQNMNADIWQEEGHWLLLPLLFFAALWARRGWLASLLPLLFAFSISLPQPAQADTDSSTMIDTEHLWLSPDQKAMRAFNAGEHEKAAEEFSRPDWKASALYRKGDYQGVIDTLKEADNSDGFYNSANALAKLGNYHEAIDAYEKAIELDASNEDAAYNLELVKKALQQQQQNQQQDGDSQDKNEQDQQQSSDDSQQQKTDENNQDQQNADDSEQQDKPSEQQPADSESSDKKQQQNEDEQLKQRDAEAEAEKQQQEQQQYEQQQQEQRQEQQDAEKDKTEKSNEIENENDADDEKPPAEIEINPVEASITEEEKATEQWLKRIPDDPGGLLRRKFYYQYKQIPNQKDDNEPW